MDNPDLPSRPNPSAGVLPKFAEGVGETMDAIQQSLCPNARETVRFVFSDTPTRFVSLLASAGKFRPFPTLFLRFAV